MYRSPLDSCFAMYRTLFGQAYPFSYDFKDLARYYAAYRRLVEHWCRVLGECLCLVSYEAMIEDPAAVGSEVARHCGLEWRAEATNIAANSSPSLSASAAQIRRPIYKSSRQKWLRYQKPLGPLIDMLRSSGVANPTTPGAS